MVAAAFSAFAALRIFRADQAAKCAESNTTNSFSDSFCSIIFQESSTDNRTDSTVSICTKQNHLVGFVEPC